MATKTATKTAKKAPEAVAAPRLKTALRGELRPQLKERARLSTRSCRCPRLQKITLNMGVGEAKTDAKALDAAMEELSTIAGQRAQMRRATQVDRRASSSARACPSARA